MQTRLLRSLAACVVGLLLLQSTTVQGQDLTTMLNLFLRDLYAGTIGVNAPVQGVLATQGVLTANAQAVSSTATWNNAAVAFTGWKEVITDTASAAGSLAVQILGGAAGSTTLFSVDKVGNITAGNSVISGTLGNMQVAATRYFLFDTRSAIGSAANGSLSLLNAVAAVGIQDTFGADVTINTCGTGTVTTGSRNAAGNITATGATSCTVVFATPTFTNKPFCVAVPETGTPPTLIVNTTVGFTVTGLTSGAAFNYLCRGRIG